MLLRGFDSRACAAESRGGFIALVLYPPGACAGKSRQRLVRGPRAKGREIKWCRMTPVATAKRGSLQEFLAYDRVLAGPVKSQGSRSWSELILRRKGCKLRSRRDDERTNL